jgi:hypothetical protein
MREWLSMHFENGNRLVRLLHIICFILENILDEFSGRHWAFLCSTIHAAFSGHFEPLSNFFVNHPPSSIFLFACSLDPFALDHFIEDLSFANCLIRELISFHHFKGFQTPNLLNSVVFAAADFLSILLLSKFMRSFPALPDVPGEFNVNPEPEHAPFSPALSLSLSLTILIKDQKTAMIIFYNNTKQTSLSKTLMIARNMLVLFICQIKSPEETLFSLWCFGIG